MGDRPGADPAGRALKDLLCERFRFAEILDLCNVRSRTAYVCDCVGMAQSVDPALRYTVALAALLNLGYFGVEFSVALVIGSVSLFADSIDFLEDATVNGLILVALR